jgi:DNA mismatch repair ATPase MutS
MRKWICNPLFFIEEIEDRLNAVEDLMNENQLASMMTVYCSLLVFRFSDFLRPNSFDLFASP